MHKGQCECEFECERLGKPLASVFGALQVTRSQQFTTQILSVKRGTHRRTELSATSKLSSGDETPPIANVLLVAVVLSSANLVNYIFCFSLVNNEILSKSEFLR